MKESKKEKSLIKLLNHKQEIEKFLPKHYNADIFLDQFANELTRFPQARESSILGAMYRVAQIGLYPSEGYGYVYFNVDKFNDLQFMVGYKGYLELLYRSGKISACFGKVVYKGDAFDFILGTAPEIRHIPTAHSSDVDRVYFYIKFTDGTVLADVMTEDKIKLIRTISGAYSDFWDKHYETMAVKTVLMSLVKYTPISFELSIALSLDSLVQSGASQGNKLEFEEYEEPKGTTPKKKGEDALQNTLNKFNP
jgi:recombination protein RecT